VIEIWQLNFNSNSEFYFLIVGSMVIVDWMTKCFWAVPKMFLGKLKKFSHIVQ
jgi:hypothetical protein